MMGSDVEVAVAGLAAKKRRYSVLWDYYDGRQPLVYSSEKLKEIFSGLAARFTENWCAVVVDSVLDRMELFTPAVVDDAATTAVLGALWEETGLVDDEYGIHEDVAVTGESFVVAWPDEEGRVQAFHNDARLCHAVYDGENPRRMRFAAKWWATEEGVRLTLYYADRLEYYASTREYKAGETPTAKAFEPFAAGPGGMAVAENPYGVIPVFHFRSNQRQVKSQLANVVEVQDAVNKLLADMMVAAEFGAFPQRYVISSAGIVGLQNNPNAIWDLVAGEQGVQATQAGQFAATELMNYLNAINKLSADIGIITRTPRHYFYQQGGDPSGEALLAMEAPLNRKTQRLQAMLAPTWRDLGAFLLLLAGRPVATRQVSAVYAPVATVQPRTEAEIRKLAVEAGVPLRTHLRREEGWTAAEVAAMDEEEAAQRVAERRYADAVLGAAQRDFDGGVV
jgi:hypothetical protein